jgi:hypothetical protein
MTRTLVRARRASEPALILIEDTRWVSVRVTSGIGPATVIMTPARRASERSGAMQTRPGPYLFAAPESQAPDRYPPESV